MILMRKCKRNEDGCLIWTGQVNNAGVVRGVVAALGLPIEYVEPRVWKRRYSLDGKKAASRAKATELFPDAAHYWKLAKNHDRSEAALIAAYGWEMFA